MALYVCDATEKKLYEMGLDGSNPTALWISTFAPYFPKYHAEVNKFFFTGGGDIYSINYDGSGETKLIDFGSDAISAIDIDSTNNKIYYGIRNANEIRRCNFDGGNDEIVLTPTDPGRVQVDIFGGKCYWTRESPGRIYRDTIPGGGNEELLVSGVVLNVEQFDLDLVNNKIYWCDSHNDLICRCNLDGSSKETIITSSVSAWGCAVDGVGGKVYWAESSPKNVKRANLDGSNPEIIWSGSTFPVYLHAVNKGASSGTTSELPLRIIHRLTKTGDYDPQLIGTFVTPPVSANIEVWDVVDGQNTAVTIVNSGCYAIGNTGKFGWSLAHLPFTGENKKYHYYYRMTSNEGEYDHGEFLITVPEHGRWSYPG